MARGRPASRVVFPHRFRILRTASFLLMGVMIWLLLSIGSIRQFISAYQRRNLKRDSVEAIQDRVLVLQQQKTSLAWGMFENEKSVREAYRLVLPGEKLILLSPDASATSVTAPAAEAEKRP